MSESPDALLVLLGQVQDDVERLQACIAEALREHDEALAEIERVRTEAAINHDEASQVIAMLRAEVERLQAGEES